ncbi:hypothetical protein LZC95_25525 [Pendulispora brunnea]|uniref:NGO1945-like C-terminal domain-containing protein n=1 Tax=Pendulispora brunnea TaxID=2905690 RepID=A0ABZ2KR11_9BACT
MDASWEQVIRDVCVAEGDEERDVAELARGLDAPQAGRLLLYRRLVRGNLEAVARKLLPRTAACLDRAENGFGREFGAFLAEAGTRTHFLRDIGGELVRWGAPARWAGQGYAPHLADLARYEVLEFEVGIADVAQPPPARAELALDRGVVFHPTARLAHFAHAVHEEEHDPPAPRAVALLVFRDAEHAVHTRELDPTLAPVMERLLAGESLAEAVRAASARAEGPIDDALLAQVAQLLAALAEEGVLLGAA